MINQQIKCAACNTVVPAAHLAAQKWAAGLTVVALGRGMAKSWFGLVLIALAGVAAGAIVEAVAKPVCGTCRSTRFAA